LGRDSRVDTRAEVRMAATTRAEWDRLSVTQMRGKSAEKWPNRRKEVHERCVG